MVTFETKENSCEGLRNLRASFIAAIPFKLLNDPDWLAYWRKVDSTKWLSEFIYRFDTDAGPVAARLQSLVVQHKYYLKAIIRDQWYKIEAELCLELTEEQELACICFAEKFPEGAARLVAARKYREALLEYRSQSENHYQGREATFEDFMRSRLSVLLDWLDKRDGRSEI